MHLLPSTYALTVQATMHAALSAHMKRAAEDAHKPLPASIRWFGKLCVAYGSALVALLVRTLNLATACLTA